MINVLELIDGGFIGGGQTHIISLTKNLDQTKFKTIITASPQGEFKNLLKKYDFEFQGIHLPKIFRKKHLLPLKEIVKRKKINIVHSHGGVAGVYSRMLKKDMTHIKVVHSIHGIHYINSKNPFRNILSKIFEQYLMKYTDKFIVASRGDFEMARKIKIINPDLTEIIPNGIELSRFYNSNRNVDFRSQNAIPEKGIIVGNISRFDIQKNQILLTSLSKEIINKYSDTYFIFVGNGKYLGKNKHLAKSLEINNHIIFIDETKETEKYYKNFDIFAFPSLWEGLSITVIESMASGNCILISDIPQNKELITDYYNGLTFKSGDKKDFLEKLFILFENKQLRNKLSENALKESVKYNEKSMAEKIQNVYLCLI
jgi:glycosyltransferase involved in cell wall biosynthesis